MVSIWLNSFDRQYNSQAKQATELALQTVETGLKETKDVLDGIKDSFKNADQIAGMVSKLTVCIYVLSMFSDVVWKLSFSLMFNFCAYKNVFLFPRRIEDCA